MNEVSGLGLRWTMPNENERGVFVTGGETHVGALVGLILDMGATAVKVERERWTTLTDAS